MSKVTAIEGIGSIYGAKLQELGIRTTGELLNRGATPQARRELARELGVDEEQLLRWINRADLFRVKGIGRQYSDLLEAAGVDTVPELAQRNPDNLHAKLVEVNRAQRRVRQLPTPRMVRLWVEQARRLPRVIQY